MRAENPLGFALAGVGGIVGGTVATIDGVATGNVALSTDGGVSTSIGGSDGLNASVGGGDGVSASLGGSGGVSVGVGGGNGVSVGIGGLSIGLH
jgi:hypothetical protein